MNRKRQPDLGPEKIMGTCLTHGAHRFYLRGSPFIYVWILNNGLQTSYVRHDGFGIVRPYSSRCERTTWNQQDLVLAFWMRYF